jgi:hypothetical protein
MTVNGARPGWTPDERIDPRWGRIARFWGVLVGVGLLAGAILFLIESQGLLGAVPTYASTSAGQLQDEARYWVAFFAYRNATMWDYLLRDGIFFVAFIGFIPLALAVNAATGGRRALVQVTAGFLGVGALFGALNAVTFLVDTSWWRSTGWEQVPPEIMVAVGRGTELMDDLSSWCGTASAAAFAIGLYYLGKACLAEPALPRRLAPVAFVGAALEAVLVLLVVLDLNGLDLVQTLLLIATGVVIAPVIAIWLGVHLGRVLEAGSKHE